MLAYAGLILGLYPANKMRYFVTTSLIGWAQAYNQPYHKTSSISRTKSQSLNASCILLQLSSHNPLKPGFNP